MKDVFILYFIMSISNLSITLSSLLYIHYTQTAAFVHATDSRYGFNSKDLRKLGGSELSRMYELMSTDHGK